MLIIFIAFFIVIQGRVRAQHDLQRSLLREGLADLLEREFLLAAAVHDGYVRDFELPTSLQRRDYELLWEDPATLIIRTQDPPEEYVRFLTVNASLVTTPDDPEPESILAPGTFTIILERRGSEVLIRKDCALDPDRRSAMTCNTTAS